MIYAYVGRPRSGKTLDAVRRIIDHLSNRRVVCSDIEGLDDPMCIECMKMKTGLSDTEFKKYFVWLGPIYGTDMENGRAKIIRPSLVPTFWSETIEVDVYDPFQLNMKKETKLLCPFNSFIVLDEVHKSFSCREWSSSKNKEFSDWMSTHGHEGYDLVLITQDIKKIDSQLRTLIESTYYYRKVNFLGSLAEKRYIKYLYDGYEHEGTPMVSPTYHTYDSEIYNCYKSMSHAQVKQIGIQKKANILKQPIFFAIPVIFGIFLYFLFYKSSFASGDLFGAKRIAHKNDVVVKQNVCPSSSSSPVPSQIGSLVPAVGRGVQMLVTPLKNHSSVRSGLSGGFDSTSVAVNKVIGVITYDGKHHVLLSSGQSVIVNVNLKAPSIGSLYSGT